MCLILTEGCSLTDRIFLSTTGITEGWKILFNT